MRRFSVKITKHFVSAIAAIALIVASPGIASAEPGEATPGAPLPEIQEVQQWSGPVELSREANERRETLVSEGFFKVDEQMKGGRTVETYRKVSPEGVAIEFDVIGAPPSGMMMPLVNFEWDWGPRIYMTGAEFWSLGASGFGGVVCGLLGGGLLGGAACSVAATAAWNKIAGNNSILNDQTCYDLSQALNIGWTRAPEHKCS